MSFEKTEQLRLLVQEEGKAARNILAFSVPLEETSGAPQESVAMGGGRVLSRKPPSSPRTPGRNDQDKLKVELVVKKLGTRLRSASAGRDRKSDLQARYWGLLFENLRRAMDEIYLTCETDESVEECKEVIMILDTYTKDFHNLIEWLKLKWAYEKTPAPHRPTSLAWEIRKSSPAKPSHTLLLGKSLHFASSTTKRVISFNEESTSSAPKISLEPKTVESLKSSQPASASSETVARNIVGSSLSKVNASSSVPSSSTKTSNSTAHLRKKKPDVQKLQLPATPKAKPESSNNAKAGKNALNSEMKSLSGTTLSDDGWETVRGRTRSRTSPGKGEPLRLNRSTTMIYVAKDSERFLQKGFRYQNRDVVPSTLSTRSLPSLSMRNLEKAEGLPAKQLKTEKLEEEEEEEIARKEEALAMEEESLKREMQETEIEDPFPPKTAWAERLEYLDQLERVTPLDARQPGRAPQVHEKLSSPSRRRAAPSANVIQQHEAKQLRAQQQRAALQEEKSRKQRELARKIEEVRQAKNLLVEQRRAILERKMKQAEEKRQKHLADIVKKAHDEEEKLKEIAFINELEAQNKRHDFFSHIQTQEERIQGIQEERQRRQEERKLAKEAAVEERKRALEAERQAKMAQLQEKRRQREERIDRELQEKEKERQEMAREKQRDREERLSALQAAHQATLKGLKRKIQQKQEESARRHEENIEQIRQKALELSILRYSAAGDEAPQLVNYDTTRMCTLCNVHINSEVFLMSHLRGPTHTEALKNHYGGKEPSLEQSEISNLKFITEAPALQKNQDLEKEKRVKLLKKRSKKLRQKLVSRSEAALSWSAAVETTNRNKICKILRDLEKHSEQRSEKLWAELNRILDKGAEGDQLTFCQHGGLSLIQKFLQNFLDNVGGFTPRLAATVLKTLRLTCRNNWKICGCVTGIQLPVVMLELLDQRLDEEKNTRPNQSPSDFVATAVMETWIAILETTSSNLDHLLKMDEFKDIVQRLVDLISYAVSLRLVDALAVHIGGIRGPFTGQQSSVDFLLTAVKFLTSLTQSLFVCQNVLAGEGPTKGKSNPNSDATQLVNAFKVTEIAGTVNALYGLLLHRGVPCKGQSPPPQLPETAISFAQAALQLLYRLALLDLNAFQEIVGAEGVSLEFRHIASFLLWFGSHSPPAQLLHLTIICVGYFAANHLHNQMILQLGNLPSVLQQLCRLPFCYFTEESLRAILFPTLLACCHGNSSNRAILEKEMSYQMLEEFVNSGDGRLIHMVKLVNGAKK